MNPERNSCTQPPNNQKSKREIQTPERQLFFSRRKSRTIPSIQSAALFGLLPIAGKLLNWRPHIRWMNDMIKELESVALTTDLPEHGVAKDDCDTVVLAPEGGKGCTVEFIPKIEVGLQKQKK